MPHVPHTTTTPNPRYYLIRSIGERFHFSRCRCMYEGRCISGTYITRWPFVVVSFNPPFFFIHPSLSSIRFITCLRSLPPRYIYIQRRRLWSIARRGSYNVLLISFVHLESGRVPPPRGQKKKKKKAIGFFHATTISDNVSTTQSQKFISRKQLVYTRIPNPRTPQGDETVQKLQGNRKLTPQT